MKIFNGPFLLYFACCDYDFPVPTVTTCIWQFALMFNGNCCIHPICYEVYCRRGRSSLGHRIHLTVTNRKIFLKKKFTVTSNLGHISTATRSLEILSKIFHFKVMFFILKLVFPVPDKA